LKTNLRFYFGQTSTGFNHLLRDHHRTIERQCSRLKRTDVRDTQVWEGLKDVLIFAKSNLDRSETTGGHERKTHELAVVPLTATIGLLASESWRWRGQPVSVHPPGTIASKFSQKQASAL